MEGHGILKAFPKVKRRRPDEAKDAPSPKRAPAEPITDTIFKGATVYIVPAGIGKTRCDIFHRQIIQNGGQSVSIFSPSCTHVVVDDSVDCKRALRLLKVEKMPPDVQLVKCTWLSACISEKRLLESEDYSLLLKSLPTAPALESEETEIAQVLEEAPQDPLVPTQVDITEREACKIPGIGKRMADKIKEIMESGHLRKLDHIGEEVPVLEMFTNIWGAGAKTAQMWYQQGFRTLKDIRTKAVLNQTLRIGLKHYDDLLERMPRSEAAAIEKTVKEAAHNVDEQLVVFACGSYRRGKTTCGDVDVLITHPDGESHKGVFSKLLHLLHQTGFLTDDLVSHEENGEQKKYMGICRLPGPLQRHRRLDIIVVPYAEFACALLYFTGSAHFNRSMRALAKTKGMSLSEHSLNCHVVRQRGVKLVAGTPLHTPTEKDVFKQLGVPYREPHERDW
ncbi:DNA polymerase lambda isoform X3 [Paramisgurnus dabryanus]|uniref:DNA polymerase lambda isoform X3 n=1 Tax=Paramisgurnus dabryanus TaxID=90735 RepID=UPI0031F44EDC